MTIHRICYDKILPRHLLQEHEVMPSFALDGTRRTRAIMPKGKNWPNGSRLHVRFMQGTPEQRQMVRKFAPTWCEFANLELVFDDAPQADIRIDFDPDDGSWSYIGTDCRDIPIHAATMNLGWQDEAVILHEFGHALGLAHEHQNPAGGIEWNDEVVIRDLGGAPNFWDPETVRHNVLEKYSADQINGTHFDADSIMLYAFPGTWTKSGHGTKENASLSTLDKQFISSTKGYPGRGASTPKVVPLEITNIAAVAAAIRQQGEEDLYSFEVTRAGVHTMETDGTTDVVMKLFGPNSRTQLLAEDDDSGVGPNPKISTNLVPGTYYLQLRHFQERGTGEYTIRIYR